jgi:hypothetical protein
MGVAQPALQFPAAGCLQVLKIVDKQLYGPNQRELRL